MTDQEPMSRAFSIARTLFGRDYRFNEVQISGIPASTSAELEQFWTRIEFRSIAEALLLPPRSAEDVLVTVDRLSSGTAPWGDFDWTLVSTAGVEMRARDALAASIVHLLVFAAWAGPLERLHIKRMDELSNDQQARWYSAQKTLAESLLAADVVFSTEFLLDDAINTVDGHRYAGATVEIRERVTELYRLRHLVRKRYGEAVHSLAWDTRAACSPAGANLRPHVAALFWTLGDVGHADQLAHTSIVPPLALVVDVVHESLRRIPFDPFVQEIWLAMKDRGPLDLRAHKLLFTVLNSVFRITPLHQYDASMRPLGLSPSRVYASSLIEYFSGDVSTSTKEALSMVHQMWKEFGGLPPAFAARYLCLVNLIFDPVEGTRADKWRWLESLARETISREQRDGTHDAYDRSQDIAIQHMDGDAKSVLEAVEAHRVANLWYSLAVSSPLWDWGADGKLRAREQDLQMELRGLRYVTMLPKLPPHFRRTRMGLERGRDIGGFGGPYDPDLFSVERAFEHLLKVEASLERVRGRVDRFEPGYATAASTHPTTIDEFAGLLRAHAT